MSEHDEPTYGLALPFDTDDPEFARGAELGMVWEALQHIEPWESHDAMVHGSNALMMIRMSEALDRPLLTRDNDPDWFSVTFGPVRDRSAE